MNRKLRIIYIYLIVAAVLTAVFLLLPSVPNAVIGFVFGLIGVATLGAATSFAFKKNANYPFDAAFALLILRYFILQIVISAIVIVLELLDIYTLNSGIFIVVHIILLAAAIIRSIVLGAGKKYIDDLDKKVKAQTFAWGMLVADTDQIREKIDHLSPEIQKEIETTCDEIRYSDPMGHKSLETYDNEIKESVITLDKAVESWNDDKISKLCTTIKRQIKDRNNQLKLLK